MAGWEKEHMPSIPGTGAERALRAKAHPGGRVGAGMLRELAKWVGGCQHCWLTALLQLRPLSGNGASGSRIPPHVCAH